MSQKKVHSVGLVPFSWEKAPGVCKASRVTTTHVADKISSALRPPPCSVFVGQYCSPRASGAEKISSTLPPPPCPIFVGQYCSPRASSAHDLHIPLTPCPFQANPVSRSSSYKKGIHGRSWEDPFLAAYNVCTKNVQEGNTGRKGKGGLRAGMGVLSCKQSCQVREGSLVKTVRLQATPRHSRSQVKFPDYLGKH